MKTRPTLVIMVKEPRLGRVKTRLARDVGHVAATRFYRITTHAIIARLAATSRWPTMLAVAPDLAISSRCWPPDMPRSPQGSGDLGRRMQTIMRLPVPGPIVIVGSDIPAIRPSDIADAFRKLGSNDAVFGPATDGGYWLVGFKRSPRVPNAFRNIRWSGPHALADTIAGLGGLSVAMTTTLADVDHGPDLASVASWCGRRVLPPPVLAGCGAER